MEDKKVKSNQFIKEDIFSTPIFNFGLRTGYKREHRDEMLEYMELVRNASRQIKPDKYSTGWVSPIWCPSANLETVPPVIDNFISREIIRGLDEIRMRLGMEDPYLYRFWYTSHSTDQMLMPKVNTQSAFTGIVFLNCPDKCGNLVLRRPDYYNRSYYSTVTYGEVEKTITPHDNLVVIFPSYLEYMITPNQSDVEFSMFTFEVKDMVKDADRK